MGGKCLMTLNTRVIMLQMFRPLILLLFIQLFIPVATNSQINSLESLKENNVKMMTQYEHKGSDKNTRWIKTFDDKGNIFKEHFYITSRDQPSERTIRYFYNSTGHIKYTLGYTNGIKSDSVAMEYTNDGYIELSYYHNELNGISEHRMTSNGYLDKITGWTAQGDTVVNVTTSFRFNTISSFYVDKTFHSDQVFYDRAQIFLRSEYPGGRYLVKNDTVMRTFSTEIIDSTNRMSIAQKFSYDHGLIQTTRIQYDVHWRKVDLKKYNKENEVISHLKYFRDEDGHLIKSVTINDKGKITSTTENSYFSNGLLNESKRWEGKELVLHTSWDYKYFNKK